MKYLAGFTVNLVFGATIGLYAGAHLDTLIGGTKIFSILGSIVCAIFSMSIWTGSMLIQRDSAELNMLLGLWIGLKVWPIGLIIGGVFGFYDPQFGITMFNHVVSPVSAALAGSIAGVIFMGVWGLTVGASAGLINQSTNNEIIGAIIAAFGGSCVLIIKEIRDGVSPIAGEFPILFSLLFYSCTFLIGMFKETPKA